MKRLSTIKPTPTNSRLRPRRTLNRLALALLALGIGGIAQSLLKQDSLWDGLMLYVLAAILFVYALDHARPKSLVAYRGLFAPLDSARGLRRTVGVWLIFGAFSLSLIGWQVFGAIASRSQAWWFYAGSVALMVAGAIILTPREEGAFPEARRSWHAVRNPETIILILIVLIAVGLRLWHFTSLPFGVWYDEAEAGLQARQWLAEPSYKPAFYDPINISGQLIILYSTALRFVSNSVWGLRLVSVLFGVSGVGAAYLFGRQVGGSVLGLGLAFAIAVMRWDINFSRIAMTGIDTPFFDFITLFYLARLLRHGRLRDAAFAGLWLGLGLSFYTAFRLFVLAVGLFAVFGAIIWPQWWAKRADPGWWGRQGARLGILLFAAWITLMPVAQYAIRHPDSYWARVRATSILNRRDDPNLPHALLTSLERHVAMFNLHGDNNGRHNLPGEPELDPLMGVLMVLGIALALRNANRPAPLFFLLLFPIALSGGIFSLDFEAPQSLRSIAVLPAVAYFCILPVLRLATESRYALRPLPQRWLLLPAGLLGLYVLWFNAYTYFVRQANDFAVWNAFSTPETITGKKMAKLGPGYDFFLSPFLTNHPTIRFLSPNTPHQTVFNLPDALPIRTDATRPAALFIHPDDGWIFNQAQRLYPAGQFETVSNRPENPPAVHIALLSPADIASVQGLALRYWAGSHVQQGQSPAWAMRTDTIDADWTATAPVSPPFVAEWEGTLYAATFGRYRFHLIAPADATLEIDGFTVLSGIGEQTTTFTLAQGNHHLRLQAASGAHGGAVHLHWQPPNSTLTSIPRNALYTEPITNHGLLGQYYPNSNWQNSPALVRVDPFLDTYFHFTPLPRPYTVLWSGSLVAPVTGIYNIGLRAVGVAQLFLDGQPIVTTAAPNQITAQALSLTAGQHHIVVQFLDNAARSQIHLLWAPPGTTDLRPIPAENLWPPLGENWQPTPSTAPAASGFQPQPLALTYRTTLSEGLREPRDVAVGPTGIIYVADTGSKGVHLFEGITTAGTWTETSAGPFVEPLALVTTADGRVWVLDSTRQQVYSFGADGTPLGKLGGPEAHLYHPRGLALLAQADGTQTLAIVNTGGGQLALYSLDGVLLGTVGTPGAGSGQLNEPVDVLRDDFGAYFVTEGANAQRWQRLDPFGKSLALWPADSPVAMDGSHLAWGPDGSIFMTNGRAGAVRRFAPDGTLLNEWHSVGPVTFKHPVGIYFDPSRSRLFVTDVGAGTVIVFDVQRDEK